MLQEVVFPGVFEAVVALRPVLPNLKIKSVAGNLCLKANTSKDREKPLVS